MILHLIEDHREIEGAQRQMETALRLSLPHIGTCRVAYKTGGKAVDLFGNGKGDFYGGTKVVADGSKFWNVFGILKSPHLAQDIVVQINLDLRGRQTGGFVARDEKGKMFLLHSGLIGGGVKGVGKAAFLDWLGDSFESVVVQGRAPRLGIVVAELGGTDVASRIGRYVDAVHRFKAEVKQRYSRPMA